VFPTVREPSSGHVSLRSLMANLYYDIPLDNWFPSLCRFRPYIGAGLGATESRINGVTSPTLQAGIPGVFGPTVLDTASRYTYTWQARIGFSYCLTRNSEFFGGYRHLETRTLEFRTEQFPEVIVAGANIDELEFGIRIFF
jgi:opacity protein-like surface antigen